ncbi:molybdopterin-dependent oxidoreductase [Planotetraspora sp. A-T 1434]|uniref:molybdopterin-dependent oxidoreductase n=1 Tax=Planotetraspora sp. A-T 1434 TaxID=2979219 RepID=UPI0021C09AB7|nr:molybdopterin-dependent oxidoreductase [Planotetraspora sp. A-T 1434]MCT9929141.1 molybdopterin-dependent oxidoreductase [Planotetraspora sp. A-T 1434]
MNANESGLRIPGWAAATIGVASGAVALGVAELAAGLINPGAAPVIAVGGAVVDRTPAWIKEWAIRTFGSDDKPVLISGIVIVVALIAAGIGLLARRRVAYGKAGLALFGLVGAVAAVSRPDSGGLDFLPSVLGAAAGVWALSGLFRRTEPPEWEIARRERGEPRYLGDRPERRVRPEPRPDELREAIGTEAHETGSHEPEPDEPGRPGEPVVARSLAETAGETGGRAAGAGAGAGAGTAWQSFTKGATGSPAEMPAVMRAGDDVYAFDRRRLLTGVAVGLGVAGVTGLGGRLLAGFNDADVARRSVAKALPRPAVPAKALPPGVDLRVKGLSSFVTPNPEFYRVDTALVVPSVDPNSWTLKIHGLVDRPVELTFADLLKRPLTEADVTLTCVSNEVGGPYIGNARWLGARLADVLRDAGIRRDADMLLSVSQDGWTCGTPVDVVMDGRDALLAIAMNGEVLPTAHGFPVRQVVPGLYGYVSATKWVTEIKVTRFDQDEAYWTPRGWAAKGPIKTQSRIDVPRSGDDVPAGRTTIAGVAWAQHRGVDAVEVQVDGGEWRQATLAQVPGPDTWRQWSIDWDLARGRHTVSVRATDATGHSQTPEQMPPAPDGATGYHSIVVKAG